MFNDLFSNITDRTYRRVAAAGYTSVALFVFLGGQVLGVLAVLSVLLIAGKEPQQVVDLIDSSTYVKFLTVLAIEFATIGLMYGVYELMKRPFLASVGLIKGFKKDFITYASVSYLMYFILLIVTVTFVDFLIPAVDTNQSQELGFSSPSGFEYIAVYLSLIILPAVVEEIIFRGFLFQRLREVISLRSATLLTSAVFGLMHLEFLNDGPLNWIAAIDTFILSIFLISLLVKTKSLWSSILLHAIKNTVAFVFLFII